MEMEGAGSDSEKPEKAGPVWSVERAVSGRAKCKGVCKEKIEKGATRWCKAVVVENFGSGLTKTYMHVDCLKYPVRAAGFDFEDVEGLDDFSADEVEALRAAYEKAKAPKPKKAKTPKKKAPKRAKPEVVCIDDDDDDDDGDDGDFDGDGHSDGDEDMKATSKAKAKAKAKKKKAKTSHPGLEVEEGGPKGKGGRVVVGADGERMDAEDPVALKYQKMTISQLKDYLRLNHGRLTGTKPVLVSFCVDGEKHGRPLACGMCGNGHLYLSPDNAGVFVCAGAFDEDCGQHLPCGSKLPADEVKRGKWLIPGQDEPEDEAGAGAGAGGEAAGAASKEMGEADEALVKAALEGLAEDASDKDKATKIVKVCMQMGIVLPDDDKVALAKAGAAFMGADRDLLAAVKELRAECGTAAEAAAKQAKVAAARPKAKVEANSGVADALDELAGLVAKAKESANYVFEVRAFKKAVIGIRGYDKEITSGKAVAKSGPNKLAGVGKNTATLIDEYLTSGTMARLDELREKKAQGAFP